MRPAAGVLFASGLFALLTGLEWEGSRARWLRGIESPDELARIDAIHGLAPLPGSDVDQAIAGALEDPSEDVRLEAAVACEARALHACAGPIASWLESTDPEVRAIASRVLGHVGAEGDAPLLVRALGDVRPQVRRAAASGLGALGGRASVLALVTALSDADPIVRERAVAGLGAIARDAGEGGAATTALLAHVRDEAPEVRTATLDALAALGDPRAAAAATVALEDDVVEVRLAALRTLTRIPSSVAVPALLRASTDDEREGRAALAALARAPGAEALDAIVAALARPSVARSAEDALETRMRTSEEARIEVVGALSRALDGAAPDRVARIAGSASRLASHTSIAGLEQALLGALRAGGGPPVVEALGRTGSEDALVPILDALGSESSSTRVAALAGLEGLGAVRPLDGRILDPLVAAYERLDESERARAVVVVAGIEGPRASEWLLARLDETSRAPRVAALRALRGRSDPGASARVSPLLDDADAEVRSRAALVLAAVAERGEVDATLAESLAARLAGPAPCDRPALLLVLGPMAGALAPGAAREAVHAAIVAVLDGEDPELADAAALAVAASHDATLAHALVERAVGPSATARALRALAGVDAEEARAFATSQLDAPDPVVATAAYVVLGEIGGEAEAAAIAARVGDGLRFPVSASAAFALARLARRGAAPDVSAALATLATSHDPYVRANVAVAAARLGLPDLAGAAPLAWLAGGAPLVRAAAARWAYRVRERLDAARVDALLSACASDATQPSLARACGSPSLDDATADADVVAVDGADHPMPARLVALRLPDGSALVTYTDARGRVRLEGAPAGPLVLDAPESAVLVP